MRDEDWMVPAFRETTAALWRGTPLDGILLYNAGYNEGARIPEDQNDLPIAIPVGSQLLHAAGIGAGMKYRQTDQVVMTFFGDGATSEGDFHEAMNYSAVFGLPVVFICQNNQWAISTPRDEQTASATLAQKAIAYGMPGLQVDGNDLLAVHVATSEAVDRARSGEGPTMLECVTYRLSVHTTADDPTKYRSDEEVEKWEERDPLPRFRDYLGAKGILTDEDLKSLEQDVEKKIEDAWDKLEANIEELDGPLHMFEHVYAEPPPYLTEQKETLSDAIDRRQSEAKDG
jgi:TPP-dependent pyruvate/acetoin dehydrogenase alpha subunit